MTCRLFACGLLLVILCMGDAGQVTWGQAAPPDGRESDSSALLRAEVTRVVDGDAFDATTPDGRVVRVRYVGIEAPRTGSLEQPAECFGPEAAEFNARLLGGRTVWLRFALPERIPLRTYVYLTPDGGAMANAILLSQGFARLTGAAPDGSAPPERFVALAEEARAAGRGLWGRCRVDADGPLEITLPLAVPRVVINEVDLNPPGADRDSEWVELYNAGEEVVDVGGWVVVAGAGTDDERRIGLPADASLAPRTLLVLAVSGQALANEAESLQLRSASGEVLDETPELSDEWLNCWARVPDGGEGWVEQACTRGGPNAR